MQICYLPKLIKKGKTEKFCRIYTICCFFFCPLDGQSDSILSRLHKYAIYKPVGKRACAFRCQAKHNELVKKKRIIYFARRTPSRRVPLKETMILTLKNSRCRFYISSREEHFFLFSYNIGELSGPIITRF